MTQGRWFGIVIEQTESNYGAYAPDVPGCVAIGSTLEEVRRNMLEALRFHLEDEQALIYVKALKVSDRTFYSDARDAIGPP